MFMKGKKNRNKIELRLSTCALVQNRKIENFLGLISPQIICFIEFKSYFLRQFKTSSTKQTYEFYLYLVHY